MASNIKADVQLQDRDLALLRSLFESRVMTAAHAAALHFDGRREYAKKRLQKLKAARLVGERTRRAFEPSVLLLAHAGLALLRERGVLAEYPQLDLSTLDRRARVSDLTIRHELAVMDVKVAFHSAAKVLPSFSIAEFSTWPLLNEFTAYHPTSGTAIAVKPDGFVRFHEKDTDGSLFERAFFLEVDRSTEAQDILATRAACYLAYYKSGGFAVRNGGTRDAYRDFPFRVLMVFKTAERRNNTAERLLQSNPPILKQVLLATFDEVCRDPFGAIWLCPADYRDATKGTPFDAERQRGQFGYRRQTAREIFIEKNVPKIRLFVESE